MSLNTTLIAGWADLTVAYTVGLAFAVPLDTSRGRKLYDSAAQDSGLECSVTGCSINDIRVITGRPTKAVN
jgi:hypothetical protein